MNTSNCKPIAIPYFKGDQDGALTEAVIKKVVASGDFEYVGRGGAFTLEGEIVQDESEHIGYQYDRHPVSGERINRLVPNEARRKMTVSIAVVESSTQKVIYGPFKISAFSDYDFVDSDSLRDTSFTNALGEREPVLFFSLGQLDSVQGAEEAAGVPVHERLAIKIAEGLQSISYRPETDSEPKH